jgi:putative chitinase
MVSDAELSQIMPNLSGAKRSAYLLPLQSAMTEFSISTYLREAAFLAQIAHESGQLRWFEELWGPTPQQLRYEPPSPLATKLGNTQPGDGKRYMGRGPIQLTGRANYRRVGQALGVNLEADPQRAKDVDIAFRIAGFFWKEKGLNPLADDRDFREITRRINGGYRGWEDRLQYYNRALLVLSPDEMGAARPHRRLFVNGRDLTEAGGVRLRDGRMATKLKPVAQAMGLRILDTSGGRALLQDGTANTYRPPLAILDGVGFVNVRDLPGDLDWSEATQTATLTFPAE